MASDDLDIDPVVLDNGTWMCKAGHAGDKTARAYERTLLGTVKDDTSGAEYIGEEASLQRDLTQLVRPLSRGVVTDWNAIERFWEFIFRRQLKVGPDSTSLLFTDIPGAPPQHRRHVTEILLEKFQVPALYISNPAYLALLASGRTTGAVLEVGGGVAHVTLVIKGSEVTSSHRRSNIGGDDVTDYLLTCLHGTGQSLPTSHDQRLLGDQLKHHLAFWHPNKTEQNSQPNYTFTDGTSVTLTEELTKCPDVLFNPALIGSDAVGVDELLYDVIMTCEPAVRSVVCSNIIIAGGATMVADIEEKVKTRLIGRGITEELKIIAPPERRKSAWLGGSILAGLEEFPGLCKTRHSYHEHGWTEFLTFKESETILQAKS